MKIIITHAYSSENRGDGLLVDLALDIIKDAFGDEVDVLVIALNASSFGGKYRVIQYSPAKGGLIKRALGIAALLRAGCLSSANDPFDLAQLGFDQPDLIVGVGGGYLRTDGGRKSLKAFIAHGLQLRWVLSMEAPTFYLSQSVGPLVGVLGWLMRRWAARLQYLAVRDDRSAQLMGNAPGVHRRPDMAIFSIARSLKTPSEPSQYPTGRPRLIARELSRSREVAAVYEAKLVALMRLVPDLAPALQSAGRGNDDPAFYKRMKWGDQAPFLRHLIETERPRVVISVRLHGALESIRAGIPTIHLSYERKGFGAYDDLGIPQFVHNVNDFDPDLVALQAESLQRDPSDYWHKVRQCQESILAEYERLVLDLRSVANSSSEALG